jgi:hypothetical protein
MPAESPEPPAVEAPDRWTLIRDIGVLQVKLIVDGLRDFLLVPISLVAGIISVFRAGDPSGNEFYRLLKVGKRSERWINLFGAAERIPDTLDEQVRFPDEDIDTFVQRVESYVVDEYRKGGVTRQAKEHFEQMIRGVRRRGGKDGQGPV